MSSHPTDQAAPLYEGIDKELEEYPRTYFSKDHPHFDYYQETPRGTFITPKQTGILKSITLGCVVSNPSFTFVELVGDLNEKTNNR